MRTYTVLVVLATLTLLGNCAKLQRNSAKHVNTADKRHHSTKQTDTNALKVTSKSADSKHKQNQAQKEANKVNKKVWSAKSVIVQRQRTDNGVVRSQFATNPNLDQLYEQRYHALEKVALINTKINSLLQRNYNDQRSNYADAVSSFLNPGSFNSGSYNVQGGSMVLGSASAGSVVGVENPNVRSAAPLPTENVYNVPINSGLVDMPQPMNVPADTTNTKPMPANIDDQALGDPKVFDSMCAVLKLTFEHTQGATILDDSPQTNNAELEDGAYVTEKDNKAGGMSAVIGDYGYLTVPMDFNGKPTKSAAISMWVKLNDATGVNPLFQIADHNNTIHYDLSVVDGKPLWVHRNDSDQELFNVTAKESDFTPGVWHHLVGAYNSKDEKATLWLDGKEVGHKKGVAGKLAQNWSKVYMFEGKSSGLADNIFMFRCPLDRTKVIALYVAEASPQDAKRSHIPKL